MEYNRGDRAAAGEQGRLPYSVDGLLPDTKDTISRLGYSILRMAAELERLFSEFDPANFAEPAAQDREVERVLRLQAQRTDEVIRHLTGLIEQAMTIVQDWYSIPQDKRDDLMVWLDGLTRMQSVTEQRIERTRLFLSLDKGSEYERNFKRLSEAVENMTRAATAHRAEEDHRAKELTSFMMAQPNYRAGVERSRKELAEGRFKRLNADELRQKAREAAKKGG
jgi:hypothetical protein